MARANVVSRVCETVDQVKTLRRHFSTVTTQTRHETGRERQRESDFRVLGQSFLQHIVFAKAPHPKDFYLAATGSEGILIMLLFLGPVRQQ